MTFIFYRRSSHSACFIWPSLAVNFQDDFWIELAWLSWAFGLFVASETST